MVIACSGKKHHSPESLIDVKRIVSQIDSMTVAIYDLESETSRDESIDKCAVEMVNNFQSAQEDTLSLDEYRKNYQQTIDDARSTWNKFKELCYNDKFEEALDFYLAESADGTKANEGDFLVFFKHSNQRYMFFSEVLLPLMREFKEEDFTLEKYIEVLRLEKAMEDLTIHMGAGTDGYVPEVYPYVVMDLGFALANSGELDEALNFFDDLINVMYLITDDALLSNFVGVKYVSKLYLENEQPEMAIASWLDFKAYLEEDKSEYPEDAWQEYMDKVDAELQSIGD